MANGANDLTEKELEELFGKEEQATPPAEESAPQETPPASEPEDVTKTQAFAHRLKEEKEKARKEAREEIAAALGYESYEALQKSKENKLLEDKGLDPEQVSPIVDELVQKRLKEDPRMQELEMLKQKQIEDFATKQLDEVNKLAGTSYKSIDELPTDVIEDWRKSGNLKKSYIALHGEELIVKARSSVSKGTTAHMQTPSGTTSTSTSNKRPLTDEEKAVWRLFNPGISEEELNKKTADY